MSAGKQSDKCSNGDTWVVLAKQGPRCAGGMLRKPLANKMSWKFNQSGLQEEPCLIVES